MLRSFRKRMSRSSTNSASSLDGADADPDQQQQNQNNSNNNSSFEVPLPSGIPRRVVSAPTSPEAAATSTTSPIVSGAESQKSKFQAAGKALGTNIKNSIKHHTHQLQQQQQQRISSISQQHSGMTSLSRFDACVEAADALAAFAEQEKVLPPRQDAATGLDDCSVLVSPDGDLLLVPHNNNLFSELMRNNKEEYESAIFLGNDIQGDAKLNGFSCAGWSVPAVTAALHQTQLSLNDCTLAFTENLVLAKKEMAARTAVACDELRHQQPSLGGCSPDWQQVLQEEEEGGSLMSATTSLLPSGPNRVGPLCSRNHSTLTAALCELERYHSNSAERESKRWRDESTRPAGALSALRRAAAQLEARRCRRTSAISAASKLAQHQEDELAAFQNRADEAWNAVYRAEDLVTLRVEELMQKRSREREKWRLEQIKQQHDQAFATAAIAAGGGLASTRSLSDAGDSIHSGCGGGANNTNNNNNDYTTTPTLGATNEEIWDLVSAVADSMEDGSFQPMDLPSVPLTIPRDKSMDDQDGPASPTDATTTTTAASDSDTGTGAAASTSTESPTSASAMSTTVGLSTTTTITNSLPVASREQIEFEVGLPQLRQAALQADEDVADAADALMNLLTSMDTTRRSARVAAETSLLSACNAQAACLKSLAKLERTSLEERLKELKALEEAVEKIDVRADLNAYITADKKERGGLSVLGDDDDGGIASALAILSRHVDGSLGYDATRRMSVESSQQLDGSDHSAQHEHDDATVAKMLDQTLEKLFAPTPPPSNRLDDETQETVQFLCRIVSEAGPTARTKRSTICYALNSKRSAQAEIASQAQFDALCKLFCAILTGCTAEEGGVSNAKMCIMLAQTFYMASQEKNMGGGANGNTAAETDMHAEEDDGSPPRNQRVYVKNSLKDHAIWGKDDFWDQALSQQISESLTHSGVMSNYEKIRSGNSKERKKSEWTDARKTRWYDLSHKERIQAASQVQAVVFAQLGALAHSMMELGCGLERSCAFVRRMAIRHQLPSSQRTMLLQHLVARRDLENKDKDEELPASVDDDASDMDSNAELQAESSDGGDFADAVSSFSYS